MHVKYVLDLSIVACGPQTDLNPAVLVRSNAPDFGVAIGWGSLFQV
jgi:hypothetical protein